MGLFRCSSKTQGQDSLRENRVVAPLHSRAVLHKNVSGWKQGITCNLCFVDESNPVCW